MVRWNGVGRCEFWPPLHFVSAIDAKLSPSNDFILQCHHQIYRGFIAPCVQRRRRNGGQNRKQRRAPLLLAHPVLGSFLRHFCPPRFRQNRTPLDFTYILCSSSSPDHSLLLHNLLHFVTTKFKKTPTFPLCFYTWLFIDKPLKMMRKHSVEGFNEFKGCLIWENFWIFKKMCQITILSVSL